MANEKHIALVERLYARTAEGRLKWLETPQKAAFAVLLQGYSVKLGIEESEQDPDAFDYRFTILNANGDVVESLTDVQIAGHLPNETRIPFYKKCEELFGMARRNALGVDEVLDKILNDLA